MGRPTRRVLEQANRADRAIVAEIEPMLRATRHVDQIAGFQFDAENRTVVRGNMKYAPALADESPLILAVRMLLAEAGQHGVEIRRVGADIDHIGRDIAADDLQPLD